MLTTRVEDPHALNPQQGWVGVKSHSDINKPIQGHTSQDRRSILINDNEADQQQEPIDDNFYKRKSIFERLVKFATSIINADTGTQKNNGPYQRVNEHSNTKRPKFDSNITQFEADDKSKGDRHDKHQDSNSTSSPYNQQSKHANSQIRYKGVQQDKNVQSKYPENNNKYDDRRRNSQGYLQTKDKNQHDHHDQNKNNNKPRELERYGREGKG